MTIRPEDLTSVKVFNNLVRPMFVNEIVETTGCNKATVRHAIRAMVKAGSVKAIPSMKDMRMLKYARVK